MTSEAVKTCHSCGISRYAPSHLPFEETHDYSHRWPGVGESTRPYGRWRLGAGVTVYIP